MADITVPDGWTQEGDKLHRELEFADFSEAFGFMTRVALLAESRNHHPDWSNSWNTVHPRRRWAHRQRRGSRGGHQLPGRVTRPAGQERRASASEPISERP